MDYYNEKIIRKRIKALRKSKKYSLNTMGQKLNLLIGEKGKFKKTKQKKLKLEGENGKTTVENIELGTRGLTLDMAFAYAKIFEVSLDYIYGKTDSYQPEYESLKIDTGLQDGAIRALEEMHRYNSKDAIIRRLRFEGVSEKGLEKQYEEYKINLHDKHNEEISNIISCVLLDEDFWIYFNHIINNIFLILKNSPKDTEQIDVEKDKMTRRFGILFDDCIEYFKDYNKRLNRLF